MSVNYATGLSEYPNKGVCGLPEKFDSEDEIRNKCLILAKWINEAEGKVAVHTGAGISTACGIPDFRGPRGVWTLEKKNQKPSFNLSFEDAKPSSTHMALVGLEDAGYINAVITQNVDGLHLRSGFPRNRIAILHGDMFTEECELCHTLYQRTSPVLTVGLKRSGSRCKMTRRQGRGRCRGYIRDTILDWEDELPAEDLDYAYDRSQNACISLCLGTSLRIVPGGELPLMTKKKKKNRSKNTDDRQSNPQLPGRLVIVNLQATKRDRDADLKIHAYVDDVMARVCKILGVEIPSYSSPKLRLESRHTLQNERQRWNVILSSDEEFQTSGKRKNSDDVDDPPIVKTKCPKFEHVLENGTVKKEEKDGHRILSLEHSHCKLEGGIKIDVKPLDGLSDELKSSTTECHSDKSTSLNLSIVDPSSTKTCESPVLTSNSDTPEVNQTSENCAMSSNIFSSNLNTGNHAPSSNIFLLSYIDLTEDHLLKYLPFH